MSVLVIGLSHNSAPIRLLEQASVDPEGLHKLVLDASTSPHVSEAAVIATCNRLEIYTEVDRFHGSVEELATLLGTHAAVAVDDLLPHLYVHYDDGAISHLFHVAAGLDSMAVGEAQILGQTRNALQVGQELGTVGPALNTLFQQALRVGKRSRAETDIDRAAPSLVGIALDHAARVVGDLGGSKVVVLGAGAMAGLVAATVARQSPAELVVVNRTPARAERLAEEYGGRPAALSALAEELATADVVVAAASAKGLLLTADAVARALAAPARGGRPLALVDLALPHDIDPEAAGLDGVTLVTLATLADELHASEAGQEVAAVRGIVADEVTAFLAARRSAAVAPTVMALRSMATGVVEAEMERLAGRLPDLDETARDEVQNALRRVAKKLLHEPTVRVKELVNDSGAISYEKALAELFSLDPDAVTAVTRPTVLPTEMS